MSTNEIKPAELHQHIGDVIVVRVRTSGNVVSGGKLGAFQRPSTTRVTIHYANTELVFNVTDGFHVIEVA